MEEKSTDVVGRERELALLDAFLTSNRHAGSAMLVRGEPGIGKTALWGAAIARAEQAGAAVLACRCFESEMPLAFAALLDLLDPVIDRVGLLPDAQRVALEAALARSSSTQASPDRLAVGRAAFELLRGCAESGRVILAIDDVQWIDTASARILAYVARRLDQLRVRLLVTERLALAAPAGGPPYPLREVATIETLELAPLTPGAVSALLRARTGVVLSGSQLRRLHEAAGGNAFYALELSRVGMTNALPPAGLQQLVDERIANLPREAIPLLELLAVAGIASTSTLRAAISDSTPLDRRLEQIVDDGAIAIEGDEISFSHPLLRAAVYHKLSPARRRELHRLLASLVAGADQARHLALATASADRAIADLLAAQASQLGRRGAPDEAAELASHAQRLTPAEQRVERHERGLQAIRYLLDAGDVPAAIDALEPLRADRRASRRLRAETLIVRADAEWENRALLIDLLEQAATLAPNDATRARAQLRLAWHEVVGGDLAAAARMATRALSEATAAGVPFLIEAATVLDAHIANLSGQPSALEPAETPLDEEPMPPWHRTRRLVRACHHLWAGELDDARRLLLEEYDALLHAGRMLRLPFVLLWLTELQWRAGEWDAAERSIGEAAAIADEAGGNGRMIVGYLRALLAAGRGEADSARELAGQALRRAIAQDDLLAVFRNRWILAELELSLGNPSAAWTELVGLPERLHAGGFHQPAIFPILPTAIEAAASLGFGEDAAKLVDRLAGEAAATGGPWAAAAAAHAQAQLHLARHDNESATRASAQAAAAFERLGFPFDHGRTLLTLGRAAHRNGERRRARETLAVAAETFGRLGAANWYRAAELEDRRISGRRGSPDQLTQAELRVAHLVAEGLSNKQAAAQLFTSVATVESHLTRIYRKLGLRSRSDLAKRVAEGNLPITTA